MNQQDRSSDMDKIYSQIEGQLIADVKTFKREGFGKAIYGVNAENIKEMMSVYENLKDVVTGEDITFSIKHDNVFISSGDITIVGKSIIIKDTKVFAAIAGFADVYNMYPRTDGMVEMDFTFYNLANPIK